MFAGIFALSASAMADEPATTVAITAVSVFDPASGKMLAGRTIRIRGDKIVSVTSDKDAGEYPADVIRIDGQGRFAIPGLIDAHVHLVHVLNLCGVAGEDVMPLYLAAGVTSVRSAGDETASAARVARFAEAHPEISPRVFTCSPLLDGNPVIHAGAGRAVTDAAKVPAVLEDVRASGATTVKIYAGTGRAVGRAIINESHKRGMTVTGHLGMYTAQDAVADGIDGLEHIWSVFNYVIPPEKAAEAGHRGRVDFSNPICTSLIAEMAKRKTFVDPTLIVFRNMILLPDVPAVRDHPDNALVPKRLREFWPVYLRQSSCPQGGSLEQRERELQKYRELTGKLFRAGVPLLCGTDSPEPHVTPGYSLHQELELLVESGLPPAAALQAATLNNARALREEEKIGSIAAGKLADIVLLTANPLDDIRNTRKIEWVIRSGRPLHPADIAKHFSK